MTRRWLFPLLLILLAAALASSLAVGPPPMPLADVLRALVGGAGDVDRMIVVEVRLPRAILAVMIGATLGLSGAALQGFLRNPLAEPGLIGASGGAAFGAVVAFYSGVAGMFVWALPFGGVAGALVAVAVVWLLAGRDGGSR